MKYRKKPVEIEAFQLGIDDMPNWFIDKVNSYDIIPYESTQSAIVKCYDIKTLEGEMKAHLGDYIIKGVKGEIYPCRADIFNQTYERAIDE